MSKGNKPFDASKFLMKMSFAGAIERFFGKKERVPQMRAFGNLSKGYQPPKFVGRMLHIIDNNNMGSSRPGLPRYLRRSLNGKNVRKLKTVLARAKRRGVGIPNEYTKQSRTVRLFKKA